MIKKLRLDMYIDDDLSLIKFAARHNDRTKFFCLIPKIRITKFQKIFLQYPTSLRFLIKYFMIHSDIFAVLSWWYILLILGIGFLPVSFLLFGKFFDKGYIFSKLIGIIFVSYTILSWGLPHNYIHCF